MNLDDGLFSGLTEIDDARPSEAESTDIERPGGFVDEQPTDATGPHFANVYVFVAEFLAPMYAREGADRAGNAPVWCTRWWAHPEAVSRLEGLWQAFETLRQTPGVGVAHWWRDYADPTMGVLLSSDGPFVNCGGDKHSLPEPLPLEPAPDGLLEDFNGGS